MERYIRALEKVVIADVVKYKDEVIAKTKEIKVKQMQDTFYNFRDIQAKTKHEANQRGLTLLEFLYQHPEHPLVLKYRHLQLIINSSSGVMHKRAEDYYPKCKINN